MRKSKAMLRKLCALMIATAMAALSGTTALASENSKQPQYTVPDTQTHTTFSAAQGFKGLVMINIEAFTKQAGHGS